MKKKYIEVFLAGALVLSSLTVANAQETEKIGDVRQETLTGSETEKPAENKADGSTARDAADQPAVWMEDMTQLPLNGQTQTKDKGTQTADGDAQADVQTSEMTAGTEDAAAAEMTEAGNQDAAVQAEAGDDTADTAEDRVYIPDETLRQALQGENYNVDIDEDGYASREDMEAITSFDIRGGEGLADLTGLEAAVNLNWLTLEECGITSEFMEKNADVLAALPKLYTFYLWNNEITDISFLESIPQVKNIVLDNNEITDFTPAFEFCEKYPDAIISYGDNPVEGLEQIFEKSYLSSDALLVGQETYCEMRESVLSGQYDYRFDGDVTFTSANPEVLEIYNTEYSCYMRALSAGTAEVTASFGSKELTFQVTVQGVEPAVDDADRLSPDQLAQGMSARSILTNGQIWNWDSAETPQKVSDGKNVKSYVAYWVYRDNDPEKTGRTFTEEYFGLDDAGTLWNWKKLYSIDEEYMETEIAENVRSMVHYEGRAGLYITESDECYMAYVDGTELITQFVCENAEYVTENGYVGLKDGTGLIISLDDDNRVLTEPVEFQPVDVGYYSEYNPDLGYSEGTEFMLDSNGTLWSRADGSDDAWEKAEEGVSSIESSGYMKDSTYYPFSASAEKIENIEQFVAGTMYAPARYIRTDGMLCAIDGTEILENTVKVESTYAVNSEGDLYYINSEYEPVLVMHSVTGAARDSYDQIVVQREDGSIWRCELTNGALPELLTTIDGITELVTRTDEETGISVEGVESSLVLNVDPITDESTLTELTGKVTALIDGTYEVSGMKVYDITLTRNGVEVDPANPVTVTIPVPEEFGTDLAVYHQTDDGSLETINSAVSEDGTYVSFLAEHFSPYLLADLTEKTADPEPEDPDEPGTTPEEPTDPDNPGTTPEEPTDPTPENPGSGDGQTGTGTEGNGNNNENTDKPDNENKGSSPADQNSVQAAGKPASAVPETGDSMPAAGYIGLVLAAAAAALTAFMAGRRLRK
ncbi:MAG TPA: hypothetical protein H9743_00975 [Candidatus Mediterraneibacter vanvlietii]|nr:hypothetical protein [Candidatus Mediterraneibacter vanvlietii]